MTTDHKAEGSSPSGRAKFKNGKHMRKLTYLLVLIFVVFAANFALWFLHTRAVHNALIAYKKELYFNHIYLAYDDIKFSNFKSWRVDGVIEKVTLTIGKNAPIVVKVDGIKFKSLPFDNEIGLSTESLIRVSKVGPANTMLYDWSFIPATEKPKFSLKLDRSIGNIAELMKDHMAPKLPVIDSVYYNDAGFKVVDNIKDALYATTQSGQFELRSKRSEDEMKADITVECLGFVVNPEYPTSGNESETHAAKVRTGRSDFNLDVIYKQTPSKLQLEMLEKSEAKKAGLKKVLDSYQIEIARLDQKADLYTIHMFGNVDKQPDMLIPSADVTMQVMNYKPLVDNIVTMFNAGINDIMHADPSGKIKIAKVEKERHQRLMKLIDSFKPQGDLLEIRIQRDQDSEIMINHISWWELVGEITKIISEQQK